MANAEAVEKSELLRLVLVDTTTLRYYLLRLLRRDFQRQLLIVPDDCKR